MENKRFFSFLQLPKDDLVNLPLERRSFYQILRSALTYIPVLLGFNFIGFVIIYILGVTGLLGTNEPGLLVIAFTSALAGLLHLTLFPALRDGRIGTVTIGLLLIDGIGSAIQILFWENLAWFLIIQIFSFVAVFILHQGLQTPYKIFSLLFGILLAIFILYADRNPFFERLSFSRFTSMAAFSIYITIIILIGILVALDSLIKFRTISFRLVTTFTVLTSLTAVSSLTVAALSSLARDQQKITQQLVVMSRLKQEQIQSTLINLDNDLNVAYEDAVISQRMRFLLHGTNDPLLYQFNDNIVRDYFSEAKKKNAKYDEILLLDTQGNVLISTTLENENRNFGQIGFFQQVMAGQNFCIEKAFPRARGTSLIISKQIYENGIPLGVLIAHTNFDTINNLLKNQGEMGQTLETYLVGSDNRPLTSTRIVTAVVQTTATEKILAGEHLTGEDVYQNYAEETVLGHFTWIPELQAALLTEMAQAEVIQGTVTNLATNLLFGLFTIGLAFAIVYISSRSISKPLVDLAEKATALASGDLSTRIAVDRQDEIGTLASDFNTMAGEFQNLVRTLENKVEDRTRDLRLQANRLRVAAEVARDAATARDMTDLLNRSAQLVLDRFGFYHTGIFLIDKEREYAILRASTTAAGIQMLANNYRLKIGEMGIVSYVASTGRPRIAVDTGKDMTFIHNPLLPDTRSEMALPLKVGDEVIGILDVQSEIAEAFTQDDIAVLQIMADQLALAIERVQLVQELEESIKNAEFASQKFTIASWQNFSKEQAFTPGYKYDGVKITPLQSFPPQYQDVLLRGRAVLVEGGHGGDGKDSLLAVPLKLRGQVIGIVTLRINNSTINQEMVSLAEDAASRLAVSLENARLYTETQSLATRERAVSEIVTQITSSINIENILRTTVQELGRLLPDSEVTVHIQEGKR